MPRPRRKPKINPAKARATLRYIDLGLNSAKQFWSEVVLPDYDQFTKSHSARDAVHVALSAWHLHDWVFLEQPPSTDKGDFQNKLFRACPELDWIRDYAEAAKHRGLGRQGEVSKVEPDSQIESIHPVSLGEFGSFSLAIRGTSPVTMVLDNGTSHQFSDVLSRVIDYWRTHLVPASTIRRLEPATSDRSARTAIDRADAKAKGAKFGRNPTLTPH